jgi:hypothetical protein
MPSIYNVDPTTGIPVGLVFGNGIDGLAISADGGTLYGAHGPSTSDPSGPQIEGFSTATGALVYSSGVFSDGCVVDGVAVGAGSLAGNLYATCNNTGNVWEVVIATGVKTMILTGVGPGGVRDDFVAPDWNVVSGTPTAMFPSLLIVQSDKIYRLDPPGGGFFSPSPPIQSPPSIPTLSSTGIFLLVALLLLAAVITLRRREASLLTK